MTARAQFHTVVFDLDDTLIDGDTGKVDSGVHMAIISANPKAGVYASLLGLSRSVGGRPDAGGLRVP
jgi:hypothetical protein